MRYIVDKEYIRIKRDYDLNELNNGKLNVFLIVNLFVLFIIMVVIITPIIARNLEPIHIIVLLLFWVFTAMLANFKHFTKIDPLTMRIYLWISYLFIIRELMYSSSSIGNMYQYILFFFFALTMNFYLNLQNKKVFSLIVRMFFLIIFINIISNIQQISGDMRLSKYVTAVHVDESLFYNTNIGNVSFMFGVALFLITCVHFAAQTKKMFYKVLLSILILFGLYLLYIASSMITLIVMFYMIFIYIFFSRVKRKEERIMFILFSGSIILSLFFFRSFISDTLIVFSNHIDNNLISERLITISTWLTFSGDEFNNLTTSRPLLYLLSLKTFFTNPIFGIGMVHENFYNLNSIGMHSQVLDDLGRYGMFGLFFYFVIFKSYHNKFKKYANTSIYFLYITCLLGTFVYSLFNTSINSNSGAVIGIFLFLILPSLLTLEKKT